eukprot:CAMPEP_0196732596 /NCGR_PEP_ID=MMETSP1091-20130531/11961_1 /TAXON_ID=302021 /ORGANISM="Rhodomonas sp., Strain CCMP768" /LENGTH=49 /DNA_ID= /DNA_START= /DNA_END= /DNA_ORIENTATION=
MTSGNAKQSLEMLSDLPAQAPSTCSALLSRVATASMTPNGFHKAFMGWW